MPRNPICERCPLSANVKHICIWGEGKRGGIMLVGEAPDADEDKRGKVLLGTAGRDRIFLDLGLKREDFYITYANKCRPPGSRTPEASEISACLPYLADEIATVQPKVILCLGGSPLKAITGLGAVGANRGKVLTSTKLRTDAKILVTYHPSAALHNPSKAQEFIDAIKQDFALAVSLTEDAPDKADDVKSNDDEVRVLVYDNQYNKLIKALESLAEAETLVADCEWLASTETDDLIWPWDKRSGFLSLAFSARLSDGLIHSVGVQWPTEPEMQARYFKTLRSFMRKRYFVFHNAMADLIWLLYLGFKVKLRGDTLLLAYLHDEEQRLGLDQLAPLMAGVTPGWKKPVWRQRPEGRVQAIKLLLYNCDDTYATLKLYEALQRRTAELPADERSNILRCYSRLLLPAVPVYARMAIAGVGMNQAKLAEAIKTRQIELDDSLAKIAHLADVPLRLAQGIAGSPQQTAKFMRGTYGLDLPNSRQDELGRYATDYPIIDQIVRFRHERKLLGTYLEPWQRLIGKQRDGRIHSVYRLASSRTGRTSAELAEGGSLQLAPREEWLRQLIEAQTDEERYAAIRALAASEEELTEGKFVIVAADYSQIELRVAAWLAPERTMRRLYNEGADLHATTAAYIKAYNELKMPVAEFWKVREKYVAQVTKVERQGAKGYNFGLLYGMQAAHLVEYVYNTYGVKITLQEAINVRRAHFQFYSDLQPWHDRAAEIDFARQRTLTPTGRYRRSFKSPTEAINTPIQTTASDLTMFATASVEEELVKRGLMTLDSYAQYHGDAFLIGFVHDSMLVECRAELADEVKALVKQTMEHPDLERIGIKSIPVPLVADVKAGSNWGDAS